MTTSTATTYEVLDSGVAVIRFDRPKRRNAIDTSMLEELLAHLGRAASDEAVRVLVFSSTDPRALSAGADVREQLDREGQLRKMQLFSDFYDAVVAMPKPTIAVCLGSVVGGGAELAVGCDIRVAGDNLKLRFPGAALGVPVGPARLVTLCGLAAAKYLLLTSKTVDAAEALRLGLVSELVETDRAEARAIELAASIAEHEPAAVARLKRMLHDWDGIEERTDSEGHGQIAHLRDGAAFPNSTRYGSA